MNKVYKISNKLSKITLALGVVLGISSCSTYQPSGYESDGVYYNPKTDKTYQEAQPQYGNEQSEQDNPSEIKIGSPYFDAEGNGAEQFYYQDENDSTTNSSNKVKINSNGWNSFYNNDDYQLKYSGNSTYDWGRNDGVEINIWNNSPWYGGYYGWGSFYNPWRWGYYNPWYSNGWYGGGFGFSMNWGWNDPWYGGWGYPHYGWNSWYGNGYYGYRPRGIYSQPGNRYGGRFNNTINSTRPIGSLNGRNNQSSSGLRPSRGNTINGTTRPSREVRPGTEINGTRPTREVRPSAQGQTGTTRPTREVRPSAEQGQINGTRPTREVRPSTQGQTGTTRPTREVRPTQTQQPTYNTRPMREMQTQQPTRSYDNNRSQSSQPRSTYTPSPSRGSSMGSGSMGGGSRDSSTGGGSRGGRR